jgi:hydrogenase/urease accessory protein HupE
MRYTKPIGITAVVIGGVAAIVSPLLHYVLDTSVWQLTTRYPLIVTILVAVAMALAVTSLAVDRWLLLAVAGLISAFVLGEVFPLIVPSYHYEIGFWLWTGGAAIMTAGSVLALTGSIDGLRRAERRAGIAFAADTSGAGGASPPAGWYPDPAGAGKERFWAGEAWTENVRG